MSILLTHEFYIAIIAVLAAGVLRGFSGFGAGMVLVPSLSLLYNPMVAVITVVLLETIPAIQLLPNAIKKCHWNSIIPMSLASVVTIPMGSYILVYADVDVLRMGISILVLLCVFILLIGWHYKGEYTVKASTVTGVASGLISGATSLGGLPVILYYLSGRHATEVTRASIVVFLVITALVSLVTYIAHGIITSEVIERTVWLAPFFIIAISIGGSLFGKATESFFKTVTLTLLGSVGLVMLFT